MITTEDNMKRSFIDAIFNAVSKWELENKIICDYDLIINSFKTFDHALREEVKKR